MGFFVMVYEPREDSYFFEEFIDKEFKGFELDLALDMGTGSGILARKLLEKSKKVVALDIQKEVIDKLDLDVEKYVSNLFSNLPKTYKGLFDVIVFNPPYLPLGEDVLDLELHGGVLGVETTVKFLFQAKRYIRKKGGRIFFIASSNANLSFLDLKIQEFGYSFKIRDVLPLFFEKLFIYEVWFDKI